MILSAANCIGRPLKDLMPGGVRFISRARSDVIPRLLRGDVPDINYDRLREMGFEAVYEFRDYSRTNIEAFFFASYTDFWPFYVDLNGVPFSPWGPKDAKQKLEAEYGRLPYLTLDEHMESLQAIHDTLNETHPNAQRAMVFYDYSRMPDRDGETETKALFARWESRALHLLQPLGWKMFAVRRWAPPLPGSSFWAHYDEEYLENFWHAILCDMGFLNA